MYVCLLTNIRKISFSPIIETNTLTLNAYNVIR